MPDTDVNSDHAPVVISFKLTLKRVQKPKPTKRYDLSSLRNAEMKEIFTAAVLEQRPDVSDNVETHWKALTTTIRQTAEECIPNEDSRSSQSSPWITEEIIYLMNQRKLAKQNDVQYNLGNKLVKRKCFDTKEKWLEDQCQEIEKLSCKASRCFKKLIKLLKKITDATNEMHQVGRRQNSARPRRRLEMMAGIY